MTFTGGCQCGAVWFTVAAERLAAYACHCRECQKQSASAFGVSVPVLEEDFTLTGEKQVWSRPTDSGGITDCHFCPKCGTRLYHSGRSGREWITVKGGALDDPGAIPFLANIWVKRKAPWVELPEGLPQWETQPHSMEEWRTLLGWDT
ncbi:MAG: GFA family protein [Pseudomonadota bacterium]